MNEKKIPKVEEWWTEDQIELVKDVSKIWTKKIFKTTSGYWLATDTGKLLGKVDDPNNIPKDALLDKAAWDHEHCYLCWKTISENGDHDREGYFDGHNWLCCECYLLYIAPRINK
jgi:hypothetical protein